MEDFNLKCVICKQNLHEEDSVIVTKGLKTIVASSIKRDDGLHTWFEGKTSVRLHKVCRKDYTRPSSIVTKTNMPKQALITQTGSSPFAISNVEDKFDYSTNCFICGKTLKLGPKTAKERRKDIRLVSTLKMRDSILKICDAGNDEFREKVKARLLGVADLVATDACYHVKCYVCLSKKSKGIHAGRRMTDNDSFMSLCHYIEHSDECQFTIKELQGKFMEISGQQQTYSDMHLKNLLIDHFKDRITISNMTSRKNIICLTDNVHRLIDASYKQKNNNSDEEKLKIVLAAADIIKEDIQKMVYDIHKYPDISDIKSGGENLIPKTLDAFTQRITKKKDFSESEKVRRKCVAINHAIISAVRPRSFLSPLHVALSLTLYRLYGSKHLINMLSSIGVCSSYYEATVYMNSLINEGLPKVNEEAFIHFVFDNADVNVRTLDGHNTFHAMGGIQCVTPSSSVDPQVSVERKYSGTFNPDCIRIKAYPKKNVKVGLSTIGVKDYTELKSEVGLSVKDFTQASLFPLNVIWLSGIKTVPGWNGFMNVINQDKDMCDPTYIMGIPFINLDASNMSTIYTALSFAAEESRKQKQSCIVTFDQPLFLKASEIVASERNESDVSKIILRLGGFHLIMSFMGSLGHIMEGSGLEELWSTVYGTSTVQSMMNGHSYARCIRAYGLTSSAICNVMMAENVEMKEAISSLNQFHTKLIAHHTDEDDIVNDPQVIESCKKMSNALTKITASSRTASLWVNLLKCIDLIFKFIFAERTGNWDIHLATVIEMLPFFHAAGHLPYAKSAHIYCQEMLKINTKMSEKEYELFTKKGMFTVRRTGKYWSGTWTDMCIEQCLMRPMKSVGGLTHGRGINESTISKWIHGTPFMLKVQHAIDEFLGTSIAFSEQHVEIRESRKKRDSRDIETFTLWLSDHNPFTKVNCSGELVSLSSGYISDSSVNCDTAYEVGIKAMENMKGQNFGNLKLHRKDMVKTQSSSNKVQVRSKVVSVNPQQLFNRILCVCDNPIKLKLYLAHELASKPTSLFDDVSLRKGTKSSLLKAFESGLNGDIDVTDATFVIDGGFLVHSLNWPNNSTYGELVNMYCDFVSSTYGQNSVVVFDGYPEYSTTKNEEQSRRAAKKSSCDITFTSNNRCFTPKENFLSNKTNKNKLIEAISLEMQKRGLSTFTAEEDADVDIVRTAIEKVDQSSKVVVVGSDTDLLVLLVALAPVNKEIYFSKCGNNKEHNNLFYKIESLVEQNSKTRKALLFAHAVTGCDTTSCFYGLGKLKAVDIIKSSDEALNQALLFTHINATKSELLSCGEKFILSLYGLGRYENLNEARYMKFMKMAKKSPLRSNFNLAKLPPTTEACVQHLLRVYLQVQKWLGNNLLPTEWGWRMESVVKNGNEKYILQPVTTLKSFAPKDLLHIVSCSCKSVCGNYCVCRKSGLDCTAMCESCSGLSCNNATHYEDIEDEEL